MRVFILTISDRSFRGERVDLSGRILFDEIREKMKPAVIGCKIVPDEENIIYEELIKLSDHEGFDIVITTGGTGISPRDVTPEATKRAIQKEIPGISEALRAESLKKTPFGMLSRGVSGIRGKTLIINLPGSPQAVEELIDLLIEPLLHSVDLIQGKEVHHHKKNKKTIFL
ncbi:MAG: MogA/MoaB family molybdenum cofactor biosynthesis protein [Acidobacteriota bacterium]